MKHFSKENTDLNFQMTLEDILKTHLNDASLSYCQHLEDMEENRDRLLENIQEIFDIDDQEIFPMADVARPNLKAAKEKLEDDDFEKLEEMSQDLETLDKAIKALKESGIEYPENLEEVLDVYKYSLDNENFERYIDWLEFCHDELCSGSLRVVEVLGFELYGRF